MSQAKTPSNLPRKTLKSYLKKYGITATSPAYRVTSISAQEIYRAANQYLSGKMIDVGCGTKAKADLVGQAVEQHIGLEHELCIHDKSNVDLFGTCYSIPVEDQSFDSLICTAVMEHLEEPQQALDEMFRVLKPGGVGLFTVPMYWHLHEEPRDFYRYTRYGLEHLFKKSGYEIVELKPMSGFWTTFLTESTYYLRYKFQRGILKFPVRIAIAFTHFMSWILDRGRLVDHRFTWMYLAVVRRPNI